MTDTIQQRLREGAQGIIATPESDEDEVAFGRSLIAAAAHIDAQDAKIKALVEALEKIKTLSSGDAGWAREIARAALAAAKETTA